MAYKVRVTRFLIIGGVVLYVLGLYLFGVNCEGWTGYPNFNPSFGYVGVLHFSGYTVSLDARIFAQTHTAYFLVFVYHGIYSGR